MKMVSNMFITIFILNLTVGFALAQDTLRVLTFPPINLVDEIVHAKVTKLESLFRYEYQLASLTSSKQDIWAFDVPIEIDVRNLDSPEGWIALTGRGVHRIGWGGDSAYFIQPGNSLGGFRFESSGLPAIIDYYIQGWAELPVLDFEPDSIIGGDFLGDAKKGRTIGAIPLSHHFVPLNFLDTLLSYTRQSVSLGWLKDKRDDDEKEKGGIVAKLNKQLVKAKSTLAKGDSLKAREILREFVGKVEELYAEHPSDKESEEREKKKEVKEITMTSEAYALLKYNAEYLIDRLPHKKNGKDDD